jgi:SAM-dependent methyltransferase
MHQRLQRKWLLIEARKCTYCGLIFRYPTDGETDAMAFYENGYQGQQATDLPEFDELQKLIDRDFEASVFDKSQRVRLVKTIQSSGRLFEFGCSWGYALHQFKIAGYQPVGFELAHNRAEFGRRSLGVDIRSSWDSLEGGDLGSFDIVYSDHALEHTTNLRQPLEKIAELLKPSGYLVIFVPNCGSLVARKLGLRWKTYIGEAHTIAFTDQWYRNNLPRHGFSIERLFSSDGNNESLFDGEELVCIARRN